MSYDLNFPLSDPEPLAALRLLCDAYRLAARGQNGEDIARGDIPLRCPEPKQWFVFFGVALPRKPETDAGSERARFEAELDAFADLMEEEADRVRAKGLARAIATDDPRMTELILSFDE